MKTCIINHRRYSVEYRFLMVGNWEFTDKDGRVYLIDGQDVAAFGGAYECEFEYDGEEDGIEWYNCTTHDELTIGNTFPCNKWKRDPQINADTAIAYARKLAEESEDGVFWWKVKNA